MRSDNVTKGVERAPNRSLFYALGYTKEELERPLIGVVCSYNEIVPGHMNLDKIAEAVKAGVRAAGGTPVESAMRSRVTREYFMPMWPMAMPSHTAMAGNSTGVPPAARTPALTASAILSRFMWPGTISL